MTFVIITIQIDAIPTIWEEQLQSHAVGAVVFEEIISLIPSSIASMIMIIIEANKASDVISTKEALQAKKNVVLTTLPDLRNWMHCKLSSSCHL